MVYCLNDVGLEGHSNHFEKVHDIVEIQEISIFGKDVVAKINHLVYSLTQSILMCASDKLNEC